MTESFQPRGSYPQSQRVFQVSGRAEALCPCQPGVRPASKPRSPPHRAGKASVRASKNAHRGNAPADPPPTLPESRMTNVASTPNLFVHASGAIVVVAALCHWVADTSPLKPHGALWREGAFEPFFFVILLFSTFFVDLASLIYRDTYTCTRLTTREREATSKKNQ